MDNEYAAVFQHQIWDYFVNDIESCFRSARKAEANDGKGGQNFIAALAIFSVIDFCAGFYVGKLQPSTNEIVCFIENYFGRYDRRFADPKFSKQFYCVFRHGLAHQWSPKASGIKMDFSSHEFLTKYGNIPVLNVPPFFEIVRKALNDYELELGAKPELNTNFSKRLEVIRKSDNKQASKLSELF